MLALVIEAAADCIIMEPALRIPEMRGRSAIADCTLGQIHAPSPITDDDEDEAHVAGTNQLLLGGAPLECLQRCHELIAAVCWPMRDLPTRDD